MEDFKKRKADDGAVDSIDKKPKHSKQWRVSKKGHLGTGTTVPSIQPGDAGIWATCGMHQEGKCTTELRDLFDEYASALYKTSIVDDEETKPELDIEAAISREVEEMEKSKTDPWFQPVRVDVTCVLFFRTREPIEPVSFVHRICSDALASSSSKRSRWIKRLTPMSRMGRATEKGLEELCNIVLASCFHQEETMSRKVSLSIIGPPRDPPAQRAGEAGPCFRAPKQESFAIRTTIRNNSSLKRDAVIKQVADAVGKRHTVDLTTPDLIILVEVYKNICGMSVVDGDFHKLKRYNLAEIYNPTPKPA
ncbi:hypothetical protein MMC12_002989 [Toensbergia leucococca]|nr:hypothetical protein [Toensbergia leucococca]